MSDRPDALLDAAPLDMTDPHGQPPSSPGRPGSPPEGFDDLLRRVVLRHPGALYRCRNDPSWTMLYISPEVEAFTGYRPDELVGNARIAFADLIHPHDRERVWRDVQAAVDRGEPFRTVYRLRSRDAEWRWIVEHGEVADAPDQGPPTVLRGYLEDVTGLLDELLDAGAESAAALAESRRRFRELAENIRSVFWILTLDLEFVYVSPAFEDVWGLEPDEEEWDLARFFETVHPEDRETVRDRIGTALDDLEETSFEYRIVRPDGTLRWVRSRAFPVRDESGTVLRFAGISDDVTEGHEARVQVETANRRLAQIFSSLQEAVFLVDEREILDCNPAAERVFGYAREEMVGRSTRMLHVDQEAYEAFAVQGEPALATEGVFTTEFRMRRKDGSVFPTEHTVTVLDPEVGFPGGVVSVIRDLTHRVELERQLRQAQKLEAVGRLAGGIAHDFNNLLTVVRASSELLAADLDDGSLLREHTDEIRDATGRAAELTRQLLAFSRDQVLQPRPVSLNDVVQRMERLLRRVIGEDVVLTTRLQEELPLVEVDPPQMEQVIMNLAVNARDAMSEGGELTIATEETRLDADEARAMGIAAGPCVVLRVTDTGHGMDERVRSQIFEPFFTTKSKETGTGLGLSTVYGVVRQSGGHVDVEAAPGEGATFRVYLPVTERRPAEVVRPAPGTPRPGGSESILVVEDDRGVARAVDRILRRFGYSVRSAGSAEEALAELEDDPGVDLVLTDLVLPGADGYQLARRIRRRFPRLRILVMSGYAEHALLRRVLDDGLPYLRKPFTPDEAVTRIREVLDPRSDPEGGWPGEGGPDAGRRPR